MIKSNITAVCDAGPIIHLDEIDCVSLFCDFQRVLLPDAVWKEISQHRPSVLKRSDLPLTRTPETYPAEEPLKTMCRVFSLDVGETQALAIMEKTANAMFFTDDASARLVAEQVGFKVHGTIGILIRSIRRGQMKPEEVIGILREIALKSSLHIKPALLDEIRLRIKTEFGL